jgi:hypothetical protein
VDAAEQRRFQAFEVALLAKLPRRGLGRRFAGVDAAAREMPARDVGVPHEEDRAAPVEGRDPDAERPGVRHEREKVTRSPAGAASRDAKQETGLPVVFSPAR